MPERAWGCDSPLSHHHRGVEDMNFTNAFCTSRASIALVFTVAQRDALRQRVVGLAEEDERVVAGAIVGSFAVDAGDRFSDLDLTFAVSGHVGVVDVLDDWTHTLSVDLAAVQLVDLQRGPTTYRVLLLPGALQLDLSMTSATQFRPSGPRFRLLFGSTADEPATPSPQVAGDLFIATPAVGRDIFGWGVIYAMHARTCIERGRRLQADHYVGAVRDHALTLACLREGVTAVQARGYDDLSAETLGRFEGAHVGRAEPRPLRAAAASVVALMHEGAQASLPQARVVAERLSDLSLPGNP